MEEVQVTEREEAWRLVVGFGYETVRFGAREEREGWNTEEEAITQGVRCGRRFWVSVLGTEWGAKFAATLKVPPLHSYQVFLFNFYLFLFISIMVT